jgi:hypothetical protein
LPEIQHTVRALLQANGRLLATVVLRSDRALEAHISVLRSYERTWMVQHLAARKRSTFADATARMNLAFAYYGQLRPDVEWVRIFYRPANLWPSRVFGGFAAQVGDSATSDLRVFHYLAAPRGFLPELPRHIRVRPAMDSELGTIAQWFISRRRSVEVSATDLDPLQARLPAVSQRFTNAGLNRRRELLVAEVSGRVTGFALMEISSLGLNFSELTNAFTVHLLEDDPESRRALVIGARQRYDELGRRQCIALEEGDDLSAFEASGFVKIKDYVCWTFHREHLAALEEYFIDLFGGRRRRNT